MVTAVENEDEHVIIVVSVQVKTQTVRLMVTEKVINFYDKVIGKYMHKHNMSLF